MQTALAVGQTVKFCAPLTPSEAAERYVVRELRGDRVLVEFVCDLAIKPTYVFPAADLMAATE